MRKLEIIGFLLCVFFAFNAHGQQLVDSVRQLQTVVITQSRLSDYVIAPYELPIDSTMLSLASNGSVTDLLRKQGLGHLRSYGPGGPASPSFRGTGSSHTAILWNGINLISPLTGLLDLSLVPASFFDDATIQTGGTTSLSGNGSIGANIHLNNNLNFNQGLTGSVSSYAGSFATQYHDAGLQLSNEKVGSSTKVFLNQSDNDFKFTNRSFNPPRVQYREHSSFRQQGLLQQLHWQSNSMGIFSLKFWYQTSNTQVPNPTGIVRTSEATEDNEFYRAIAGWNFNKQNYDINYQAAYVRQTLDYADPVLNEFSLNTYNSVIQNFETNFYLNEKSQLTSGLQHTWEEGVVDAFGGTIPRRNRVAFFSAYKFTPFQRWDFAVSGREEMVNGEAMPFSPTISAKYNFNARSNVFTNVSRNYRIPTFNDLYWVGAGAEGNSDLKTETSLSAETGIGYAQNALSFKLVTFSNWVDDWIQWTPGTGQIWSPQNIKKVWSRGIEAQASFAKQIGSVHTCLSGLYSFTKSTNVSIYESGNPSEEGKQLLLTPMHEGSATLEAIWRKYSVRIVNSYTGQQYNDSDNTPFNIVDDYVITNIWLGRTLTIQKTRLSFTAEINNMFDVAYVGRPGYPLPGINFKAGIKLQFN
ncbi:MAG: TonB-dependent receptor [Cyclobacteriaceae bacterium]|nr:TonB-dependent receptor [Cyclobacteriaceae bacterium]